MKARHIVFATGLAAMALWPPVFGRGHWVNAAGTADDNDRQALDATYFGRVHSFVWMGDVLRSHAPGISLAMAVGDMEWSYQLADYRYALAWRVAAWQVFMWWLTVYGTWLSSVKSVHSLKRHVWQVVGLIGLVGALIVGVLRGHLVYFLVGLGPLLALAVVISVVFYFVRRA